MTDKEYQRGLDKEGERIAEEIGETERDRIRILEEMRPESPDGLEARFDLEASKDLGKGRALVFRTDHGYFYRGSDEYINEEALEKHAPWLLKRLKRPA